MVTFLQLLAKNIVDEYGESFEHLTVIFPNKRAGLFLSEELSKLIRHPVWMPEILTLTEYIEKYTELRTADNLTLIIKLFKAYTEVSKSHEKFEDFYFWGNMLLGDYDDVDKYLANAKDLFSNLVALKELEASFPYLTEEQIEVISKFWSSFHSEKFSREQEEFLRVWDKLYATYTKFKAILQNEQLCYEGMNERHFCEHMREYEHPDHILIAGFNALNACEKEIFSYYQSLGIAKFYWDYDIYYIANEHQEAGLYLRDNLKLFPNQLGPEYFNNFLHNGKKIEYISVPSTVGQAKLLEQLTGHLAEENPRNTAVVLCDEQMLIPVLHSIPPQVEKINITMGYPAQKTAIAALISLLCDLKSHAKAEGKNTYYYYKPVIAILNHKLIKELCPEEINAFTNYIQKNNIIYISEEKLKFHPIIELLFCSQKESIPTFLMRILNMLVHNYKDEQTDLIEKEFIFTVYTQIQNLQNTFEEEGIIPEEKLYTQLISKVINSITIPFTGEPLEGLQLMGLMETRMLDFKHLILLSANEGILPKNTLPSSFIPYNLRLGFRLPTPEHQDALFAYYFYRLLQRAEDIKITYTSGIKGVNGGEMSRFLYQMKYESGLKIEESNFQNNISTQNPIAITIPKTEEILHILRRYQKPGKQMLSPSALNTYIECPIRFYFKYIANIKEKEEIAEELDPRLLGNIFHESAQTLYLSVPNGQITAKAIDDLLANDKIIEQHIKNSYDKVYDKHISHLLDSSTNEFILHVIKKYIREMLQYDKKIVPFQIIALENTFHTNIEININGKDESINIGGNIDRVDKTESGIRVIDYKTGADTTYFKDISAVFNPEENNRNKAAFQTMLYCLMFDHDCPGQSALIPGIYNTKLLFGKNYDYHLICGKDIMNNFRHFEGDYRKELSKLLTTLFSSDVPFTQTTDEKKCKNCSYASICRK